MTTDGSSGTSRIAESSTTTSQLPADVTETEATITTPLAETPSLQETQSLEQTPSLQETQPAPAGPPSTASLPASPASPPSVTPTPFAPPASTPPAFDSPATAAPAVAPPGVAPAGPPAPGTAVAVGAAVAPGGLGSSAPPMAPPARYRPDAAAAPVAPPTKPETPAAAPPVQSVTPGPGWGWRALVAFVAGGLLTGGGFAVAQIDGGDASTVDAGSIEETSLTTTVEPEAIPSTVDPQPAPTAPADTNAAAFVAETLGPSVVQVETDIGIGSGVIYADGLVLTNHHVIENATVVRIQLQDGRRLPAEVLGSDPDVDIAVVSVGEGEDLSVAPLATGELPTVGQVAIAIGSPFQLQQTVTEGIVSAVNRPVPTGGVFTAMIQTDAPINPGNSGGALADRSGRVIGINTAIQTDGNSNTNAGIGFAIPIDTAVSVADRIVAGIPIQAGFLGVSGGRSIDGAAGVQVTSITDGSAADESGLLVGDLILSIDGAPVTAFEELAGLVVARAPGDVVELEVVRNGEPLTVEATLGARED